jgi:4-diphosphocytidyl-2-C-methyl-D-erythritol kinase
VTKNRLILRSPAKVNLGLYLTDKRPDGYHELCSIFLPIEHSDFLDIELVDTGTLEIVSNPLGIFWDQCPCDSSNILHKAYIELSSFIKEKNKVNLPSVKVNILKNIPVEAGLGGGSSNAASFLKGMNELFELKLNKKELKQIGAKLGADVPFFIDQLPALVTGIGDIIEPFELKRDYWLVLIKPRQGLSTASVYKGFTLDLTLKTINAKNCELLKSLFFQGLEKTEGLRQLSNDLEKISSSLLPEIVDIKEYLKSLDPLVCMMTGSGAAVFGLFEKQPELDFKGLKDEWFFCTTKVLRGHYADHRN